MKWLALALFLVGCGVQPDETAESTTTTWDLWINHGHAPSCHGTLTATIGSGSADGTWRCGDAGELSGQVNGNNVNLYLAGDASGFGLTAVIRGYDGALIGTTEDGRPVVGYVK